MKVSLFVLAIPIVAMLGSQCFAQGPGRGPGGGCQQAGATATATGTSGVITASPLSAAQMYAYQMQQAYVRQQQQMAIAHQMQQMQQVYEQEQQQSAAKKQRKLAARQQRRVAELNRTTGKSATEVQPLSPGNISSADKLASRGKSKSTP